MLWYMLCIVKKGRTWSCSDHQCMADVTILAKDVGCYSESSEICVRGDGKAWGRGVTVQEVQAESVSRFGSARGSRQHGSQACCRAQAPASCWFRWRARCLAWHMLGQPSLDIVLLRSCSWFASRRTGPSTREKPSETVAGESWPDLFLLVREALKGCDGLLRGVGSLGAYLEAQYPPRQFPVLGDLAATRGFLHRLGLGGTFSRREPPRVALTCHAGSTACSEAWMCPALASSLWQKPTVHTSTFSSSCKSASWSQHVALSFQMRNVRLRGSLLRVACPG